MKNKTEKELESLIKVKYTVRIPLRKVMKFIRKLGKKLTFNL